MVATDRTLSTSTLSQEPLRLINGFGWVCLYLLSVCLVCDFSSDFALISNMPDSSALKDLNNGLRNIAEFAAIFFCGLGLLRCLFSYFYPIKLHWAPLVFIVTYIFFHLQGALVALVSGVNPDFTLQDCRHISLYLGFFAFTNFGNEKHSLHIRNIILILSSIVTLKIVTAVFLDVHMNGHLSSRYLLKSSPIFIVLALYSFAYYIEGKRRAQQFVYLLGMFTGICGVLAANVRGYYLGLLIAFLSLFVLNLTKKRLLKSVELALFSFVISLPFLIMYGRQFFDLLLSWNVSTMNFAVEYRQKQSYALLTRFLESPLLGEGFGSYDVHYEGYKPGISRPYLVELEYLNLLVKTGFVGFSYFLFAFFLLFKVSVSTIFEPVSSETRSIIKGLFASIIGLMVASITNTLYSSIFFHLWVVMMLLILNGCLLRKRSCNRNAV